VLEEVEEVTFSLRRTRKVVLNTEETAGPGPSGGSAASGASDDDHLGAQTVMSERLAAKHVDDLSLTQRETQRGLTERDGPNELTAADGPRQLPPAE
jgi:hypothetical protein